VSPGWVLLSLLAPPAATLAAVLLRPARPGPALAIGLNALFPGAGLALLERSTLELVAGNLVTIAALLTVGGPSDLAYYLPVMLLGGFWASLYTSVSPLGAALAAATRPPSTGSPEPARPAIDTTPRPGPDTAPEESPESGYAVTVRCTECGADVEVPVLHHMARCSFCGSHHLVVGHDETLFLSIPEKVQDEDSLREALLDHYRYRHYLKLYQRFVAPQARSVTEITPNGVMTNRPEAEAMVEAAERMVRARADAYRAKLAESLRVQVVHRFLAPYRHGMGTLYQATFGRSRQDQEKRLGFRVGTVEAAAVATKSAELPPMGKLSYLKALKPAAVRAGNLPALPLERGPEALRAAYGHLDRKQLDRSLQVIRLGIVFVPEVQAVVWRPFWIVEVHATGVHERVLVDGASASVTPEVPELDADRLTGLPREAVRPGTGLRFLPMECPTCGWEFPFDPGAVAHFCTNCHRVFTIRDGRKSEIGYARPTSQPTGPADLVPFWRFPFRIRTADGTLITDLAHFTDGIDGQLDQIGDDAPVGQDEILVPAVRLINDRLRTEALNRIFRYTRATRFELREDRFTLEEKPRPWSVHTSESEARRLVPLYLANAFGRRDLARVNVHQVSSWLFKARQEAAGQLAYLWVPRPITEPFRRYVGRFHGIALDAAVGRRPTPPRLAD